MTRTIRFYEEAKRTGVYIQKTVSGYEAVIRYTGLVCFSGKVLKRVKAKMDLFKVPVFTEPENSGTDFSVRNAVL